MLCEDERHRIMAEETFLKASVASNIYTTLLWKSELAKKLPHSQWLEICIHKSCSAKLLMDFKIAHLLFFSRPPLPLKLA